MDTAYRTVRFLIGVPTHTLKLYLGSVDLGKYLLWSTFNQGLLGPIHLAACLLLRKQSGPSRTESRRQRTAAAFQV